MLNGHGHIQGVTLCGEIWIKLSSKDTHPTGCQTLVSLGLCVVLLGHGHQGPLLLFSMPTLRASFQPTWQPDFYSRNSGMVWRSDLWDFIEKFLSIENETYSAPPVTDDLSQGHRFDLISTYNCQHNINVSIHESK